MEIEYRDPSRRGKLIVAIGLVLALVAGGGAYIIISQAQQQAGQAGLQTSAVVVAAREIPDRKVLDAEDLEVRQLPMNDTTAQGVYAEPSKLVGLMAGTIDPQGPAGLREHARRPDARGRCSRSWGRRETISPDSPAWRAVSITVPDDRAVGGLLQPGASVDVFVTSTMLLPEDVAADGKYFTDKSTKIVYQDMLILAKTRDLLRPQGLDPRRGGDLASPGERRGGLQPRPPASSRTSARSTRRRSAPRRRRSSPATASRCRSGTGRARPPLRLRSPAGSERVAVGQPEPVPVATVPSPRHRDAGAAGPAGLGANGPVRAPRAREPGRVRRGDQLLRRARIARRVDDHDAGERTEPPDQGALGGDPALGVGPGHPPPRQPRPLRPPDRRRRARPRRRARRGRPRRA